MTRPRALVMCRSDPNGDPRPRRMIRTLAEIFEVTVLGLAEYGDGGVESMVLPPTPQMSRLRRLTLLKLGRFDDLLWTDEHHRLAESMAARGYSIVVSHDLELLPLAAASAGAAKLVFDAREYYPRHFEDSWRWRFFYQPMNRTLCADYLPRCHQVITVSAGLARAYREDFGVRPEVVESLPPFHDLEPRPTDPDRVRIVHHGNATPTRRIETMIRVMDHLPDRYSLDLYLMATDPGYHRRLCAEAESHQCVEVLPPVPYGELIPTTNRYDIGLFLCPPATFNLRHSMPNKLFEFIQARLAVAIGPLPDQSEVLRRLGCGLIAPDFEPASMAALIETTDARELDRLKSRAHEAARTQNADTQRGRLLDLVGRLVGE